jgi:hypothetical protein
MDLATTYGPMSSNTELIIGVGNYNNIHGVLTYTGASSLNSATNIIVNPVAEAMTPNVIPFTVRYHDGGMYSFYNVEMGNYLSARLLSDNNCVAIVTDTLTLFSLEYSGVDKTPRPELLAGVLYSLRTNIKGKNYTVSWSIKGFSNGDLIIFLPTSWYELVQGVCVNRTGVSTLVESLNKLSFKGYATDTWCKENPSITHCVDGTECGSCLGQCRDPDHICLHVTDGKYVCTRVSRVTSKETTSSSGANMLVFWIVAAAILIVLGLYAYGYYKNRYRYH